MAEVKAAETKPAVVKDTKKKEAKAAEGTE